MKDSKNIILNFKKENNNFLEVKKESFNNIMKGKSQISNQDS
jgi:hypothetical protein